MTIYAGQCHCGLLKATFETRKAAARRGVRVCRCDFCRRVGAVNISDPEGRAVIDAAAESLLRYRFALRTADFLICPVCGVYIAAAPGEGSNIRATLNIAGLPMTEFLGLKEAPMEHGAESADVRRSRRTAKWTPARFTDKDLGASSFGPH